jgi:hypothetical protein
MSDNYNRDIENSWGYTVGQVGEFVWEWALDGALIKEIRAAKEIAIGKDFRIAPFGNATKNRYGRWPHYHRRGLRPGQGIGRHRPFETKVGDRGFWDRF